MKVKSFSFNNTIFLKSAIESYEWTNNCIFEIAFFGYSNVGKSSVINTLTNNKKLTRVSSFPGCTKLFNFFKVIENFQLVDLPGYGYSKLNKKNKKKIKNALIQYLLTRKYLKGIVLVSDIRFPLKPLDEYFLKIINKKLIPVIILLTKSDKISKREIENQKKIVYEKITKLNIKIRFYIFSSYNKLGVNTLKKILLKWFYFK